MINYNLYISFLKEMVEQYIRAFEDLEETELDTRTFFTNNV